MSAELLGLNVNQHTEKKGNLTYLSWAWAWAEVLKHDPGATWVVHRYINGDSEQPCMWIGETAMVHTTVTVKGLARECLLPVMDSRNAAVKNPDSRKISDAIMRCMTKAISMHGLGLYIYAGEDLPQGEPDEPEKPAAKPLPHTPSVANQVMNDSEAIEPEHKAFLDELADTIKTMFPKAGPKRCAEHIAMNKVVEDTHLIYLSLQLPTPMRNAIKRESQLLNQQKETA